MYAAHQEYIHMRTHWRSISLVINTLVQVVLLALRCLWQVVFFCGSCSAAPIIGCNLLLFMLNWTNIKRRLLKQYACWQHVADGGWSRRCEDNKVCFLWRRCYNGFVRKTVPGGVYLCILWLVLRQMDFGWLVHTIQTISVHLKSMHPIIFFVPIPSVMGNNNTFNSYCFSFGYGIARPPVLSRTQWDGMVTCCDICAVIG